MYGLLLSESLVGSSQENSDGAAVEYSITPKGFHSCMYTSVIGGELA
jgi:hypothetical protein